MERNSQIIKESELIGAKVKNKIFIYACSASFLANNIKVCDSLILYPVIRETENVEFETRTVSETVWNMGWNVLA